jgi:uncharacterized membrane protein SpoIIM required for sporulation
MIDAWRRRGFGRYDIHMALLITRREVRDSLRDWRIIFPIIILTLVFPALATFTARTLFRFTEQYGAAIVSDRIVPFMLLIVGFFPMSFSLVIALETFVGEKERKSLEPLLATPLTNTQLYVGKVLAAVFPPMITSYLGLAVYVIGLLLFADWVVPLDLFLQILLLTTLQGTIMVAAAVIVSSQTTSVRAANLLASFIIIPTAFLLQVEAIVMFWGNIRGLWWLILALAVAALIFIRMGIKVFNREELIGQDIDQIRVGWIWRHFWNRFTARTSSGRYSVRGWFRQLFSIVPELKWPAASLFIALFVGLALGFYMATQFALPTGQSAGLSGGQIASNTAEMQLLYSELPTTIFLQNVRVVVLVALLGVITLGVSDVLLFMLPWILVGFLAGQVGAAGESPLLFILAAIVPHAILEVPALLLVVGAAMRWHAAVMARPPKGTISEQWVSSAADFWMVLLGLGLPLLLAAAYVEANITPQVILWAFGD